MRTLLLLCGGWLLGVLSVAGCSAASPLDGTEVGGPTSQTAGTNEDAGRSTGGGRDAGANAALGPCVSARDADRDQDGYSVAEGDCFDCDSLINPGAYDFPGDAIDDDCNGAASQRPDECDRNLELTSFDPQDGARAIGLCEFPAADDRHWGVLTARYTSADGKRLLRPEEAARVGILPAFGNEKTRQGMRMLALSSGIARALGQSGYSESCGDYFTSGVDGWPEGYPRDSPACGPIASEGGGTPLVFDPTALDLELRVPTNAKGLSFETNFYTYEYPSYICSSYDDYFMVLMEPAPEGHRDGNIVFDAEGNWISVNNSLLQVCKAGTHGGKVFACPLGTASLANSGYAETDTACGAGAATGWLRTLVPVQPGSTIKLRFTIWDTDDPNRDSLVLIDDLQWEPETPGSLETSPVIF